MFICGGGSAPDGALRALIQLAECCEGAVTIGVQACTCWEAEFDLEQQPVMPPASADEAATREAMCADCAFRPDSPERSGDERYQHSDEDLAALPHFWCHQGLRKPIRWRHPAGITVEANGDFYAPPVRVIAGVGVPFKADGSPADRCAGHAAHQKAQAEQVAALIHAAAE